jgi:hypothetical protein
MWNTGKDSKAKAQAAAKAVKKGTFKKERKVRKSVIFHRPKTLKRERNPKFPRVRCVSPLFLPPIFDCGADVPCTVHG